MEFGQLREGWNEMVENWAMMVLRISRGTCRTIAKISMASIAQVAWYGMANSRIFTDHNG